MWWHNLFPYTNIHNLNIDWVLKVLTEMVDDWKTLSAQVDTNTTNIANLQAQMSELSDLLDKIKNGDYVDLYLDSLQNWIDKNLQALVASLVKYIWFGLTLDGYFCAYIPSSWDFITFDTDIQSGSPNYGHLLLYY